MVDVKAVVTVVLVHVIVKLLADTLITGVAASGIISTVACDAAVLQPLVLSVTVTVNIPLPPATGFETVYVFSDPELGAFQL